MTIKNDGYVKLELELTDFLLLHNYTKNWLTTLADQSMNHHTLKMLQMLHIKCTQMIKQSLTNDKLDENIRNQLVEYLTEGLVRVRE